MPRIIFNGKPGESWTNDTPKVQYQFFANLVNTCGVCLQYHMAISSWFPIPLHFGCRCVQRLLPPGATADPFVDFRQILDDMPPDQQVAAVGASTYRLIREGVIDWSEAVTQSRVRTLEEIVARRKLSVGRMVDAGVRRDRAERAYSAVHTPEHEIVNAHRRRLVENLRGAGLSDAQIKQAFGERIAQQVSLGGKVGRPGVIGRSGVTPIEILAPAIFLGLGLNSNARAALQKAEPEKVELPEFGSSKAEVIGSGNQPDEIKWSLENAAKILGRKVTASDLASIAGAPDDARVVLWAVDKEVLIITRAAGVTSTRRLRTGRDGKPELYNAFLEVSDGGKGTGAKILGRQIENATRIGIARMRTEAAGTPDAVDDGGYVGFKVWPKFGYDGPLSDEQRNALPEKFRDTKTIGELYRTKEGRDAWAEHGSKIDLTFDLSPDSYSQRVWRAYREEKARDAKRRQD